MPTKQCHKIEFGDFQTPDGLAAQVVALLKGKGIKPASVIEPTCGLGAFLLAAMRGFETARQIIGLEINPEYFAQADARTLQETKRPTLDLRRADFFSFDWQSTIRNLPKPVLFLGNPPWVTSSGMGVIQGNNLPVKSNFQGHRGLDAVTGKGNFDIAEWMLIKLLETASGTNATLAMLVKTSVARRILMHAWKSEIPLERAAIYSFDAAKHFNVSANACLLLCTLADRPGPKECDLFDLDVPRKALGTLGSREGKLIADVYAYERVHHLIAEKTDALLRWRSGVKHDCANVMELRHHGSGSFVNGLKEIVQLEPDFVFPMMKGSDVAGRRNVDGGRWMIVPQRSTNEDTSSIRERAPQTWDYLNRHGEALDKRGSSIYRKRPRFAVFGVGPYTFAPWKVAICGLYKRLDFMITGSHGRKPVVFDDTVYHLSFDSEPQARAIHELLNSDEARNFFHAFTFWDAKRPITIDVLARLNLPALAKECGRELAVSEACSNLT